MSEYSDLQRLVSALIDGELTEEQRTELSNLLRGDSLMQERYQELMSVHALLHLDFREGLRNLVPSLLGERIDPVDLALRVENSESRDLSRSETTARNSKTRLSKRLLLLAAAILLAIGIGWWTAPKNVPDQASLNNDDKKAGSESAPLPVAPTIRSVAVLGQATGVEWSVSSASPNVGGGLPAGKFELQAGLIQLEFLCGAAVIVEGPAAFELISASHMICSRGDLRAHVPAQAHGFRVETPGYVAVDLGTEFTVSVNDDGQSDFHVLEGEVELWDLQSDAKLPAETLTTGRGARAVAGKPLTKLPSQKAPLIGSRQLLEVSERAEQERYAQWRRFSRQLSSQPGVLVYYGFNQHGAWERELRNEGNNSDESLTGAIIGCQWTTGRWRGKQALEFKRITDRVRLTLPGEFDSLTYAAWVRIEGLEQWLTSLMLTDGHDANEVHWQLTEHGGLLLGVNDGERRLKDYFSPPVLGPTDLGRWVHLASVYDGVQGNVRHYLDGKEISSEKVAASTKLRIGRAEIGNWAANELPEYRERSLNGRIDEMVVLSRAMSADEIHQVYEAGKPGS